LVEVGVRRSAWVERVCRAEWALGGRGVLRGVLFSFGRMFVLIEWVFTYWPIFPRSSTFGFGFAIVSRWSTVVN